MYIVAKLDRLEYIKVFQRGACEGLLRLGAMSGDRTWWNVVGVASVHVSRPVTSTVLPGMFLASRHWHKIDKCETRSLPFVQS